MRKTHNLIRAVVLFCGIFVYGSLQKEACASTAFIKGPAEKIYFLMHTDLLDGEPVLFFSDQTSPQDEEKLVGLSDRFCWFDSEDPNFLSRPEVASERTILVFEQETATLRLPFAKKENMPYLIKIILRPFKTQENDHLVKINGQFYGEKIYSAQSNETVLTYKAIFKKSQTLQLEICDKENSLVLAVLLIPDLPPAATVSTARSPAVIFQRVNPAKYLVSIDKAQKPFWLVFGESYNSNWKIYEAKSSEALAKRSEIIATYESLGVSERRHGYDFNLKDVSFLNKKPVNFEHHKVNGFANGYYIDPALIDKNQQQLHLTLFFWPQALFYFGLIVSLCSVAIGGIVLLTHRFLRRQ